VQRFRQALSFRARLALANHQARHPVSVETGIFNIGHGDINQTIVIFSESIIFAWDQTATHGWFFINRFVIH